ncbi:tail fiber domain-containing protein [Salmonella enterica]|nr:tail fiber domain-containing protein [Salmonella enterica]
MPVNVDNKTPRLDLPLPDRTNFLQDDVERLKETINDLDGQVALVAADGKLEPSQLPDNAAKVDANKILLENQLPAKVVVVDNQGKVPLARIPDAAMTGYKEASSDQSMQALNALPGDVCRRLDSGKIYFLSKSPPSVLDNWRELPPSAVYSVNGQTGPVTGIAKSGENSDITKLNGLQGPLSLPADGAAPYDAVTVRQLQQVTAGQGATMNGVMNNFIGAVEWFNGPRTQLPAGYIAADGQLASRTDAATSALWAAVNSGMLASATSDDLWQNSQVAGSEWSNRGMYSPGDGSTTFRVPDLNSQWNDPAGNWTPQGMFLRASGRLTGYGVGNILESAAPNITGQLRTVTNASIFEALGGTVGAFSGTEPQPYAQLAQAPGADPGYPRQVTFDASRSNAAYGRAHASEVRPNAAIGIWIIRANGAFNAANTNFNVITSDATKPATGKGVTTGQVNALYRANQQDLVAAGFNASMEIDGVARAVWGCAKYLETTKALSWRHMDFEWDTQNLILQGMVDCNGLYMIGRSAGSPSIMLLESDKTGSTLSDRRVNTTAGPRNVLSVMPATYNPADKAKAYLSVSGGYICKRGDTATNPNTDNCFNLNWATTSGGMAVEFWIDSSNVFNLNSNGVFLPSSDRELKKDIRYIPQSGNALREVLRWRPASFKFKERGIVPESDEYLGFIANDLKKITPEAVKGLGIPEGEDITNNDIYSHHYQLDPVAMIAKLVLAVGELSQQNEALEKRLATLEAS